MVPKAAQKSWLPWESAWSTGSSTDFSSPSGQVCIASFMHFLICAFIHLRIHSPVHSSQTHVRQAQLSMYSGMHRCALPLLLQHRHICFSKELKLLIVKLSLLHVIMCMDCLR